MKIREALINEEVGYREFYNALLEECIGGWDNVNSTDTIEQYISEKIREGIHVSHMLEALENNVSKYDDWSIWLGNSMETPTPINSKQELVEALGIGEEEMDTEIKL